MWVKLVSSVLFLLFLALSQGCVNADGDHEKLKGKMADIRQKPKGRIDPPPKFKTYESFMYSATLLRSPFQKPVDVETLEIRSNIGPKVEPDVNRPKEVLERFSLESLAMVGTINLESEDEQDGVALYGLIQAFAKDGNGQVHRVKVGNYMGKNHGRVVSVNEKTVDLLEIIPDGQKGWIERPRTIVLQEDS